MAVQWKSLNRASEFMKDLPLKQIIEGAIMASEQPLSVDQLMQLFEKDSPERASVRAALKEIDESKSDVSTSTGILTRLVFVEE